MSDISSFNNCIQPTNKWLDRKFQQNIGRHTVYVCKRLKIKLGYQPILVTFAYSSAEQDTTGFSPFLPIHGLDIETTLNLILPCNTKRS